MTLMILYQFAAHAIRFISHIIIRGSILLGKKIKKEKEMLAFMGIKVAKKVKKEQLKWKEVERRLLESPKTLQIKC